MVSSFQGSNIQKIPDEVLQFLRSDSTIILPKSCQEELDSVLRKSHEQRKRDYDTDSSESDDETNAPDEYPDFAEFDERVRESLSRFGNKAFIKLNWSAPRDAFWSINKTYCETLSDLYILLRSSNFISHDLNHAFDGCESTIPHSQNYYLVMRRWANLNPMMEFRCFVRNNKLIGVSQRECRSFYQYLVDKKENLLNQIEKFYLENVHEKFFDKSYTFDIYLDNTKVKLIDFNPFGSRTDSLFYSWDELMSDESTQEVCEHKSSRLELRLNENVNSGVQQHDMAMYAAPLESLAIENFDSDKLASFIQEVISISN